MRRDDRYPTGRERQAHAEAAGEGHDADNTGAKLARAVYFMFAREQAFNL